MTNLAWAIAQAKQAEMDGKVIRDTKPERRAAMPDETPDVTLDTINVGLSPRALALIGRTLRSFSEAFEPGESADADLAEKIAEELQIAANVAYAEGGPKLPHVDEKRAKRPPQKSQAEEVADKMAKAARKAVEE